MEFVEFHARIMKIMKFFIIPLQNNENNANLIMPVQNHENYEIHRITIENNENH